MTTGSTHRVSNAPSVSDGVNKAIAGAVVGALAGSVGVAVGGVIGAAANVDDSKRSPNPETREVDATVVALIPQYHQAKIRSQDGFLYSITARTLGVTWAALREGQRVHATVTVALPRVLHAHVIAQ